MAVKWSSIMQPSDKTAGDDVLDEDKTTESPGRGPRHDGESSIPRQMLNPRRR